MGSKGRIPLPPPHMRRPLPGTGMLHPEVLGHGMHPLPGRGPGPFPPFDLMPAPEVLEQKLAAQHVEMQRLATENHRLAATQGTLRQELAAAQHELQVLHAQIGAVRAEREQQMRGLADKIAKMESELQATEPLKLELQQAQGEARNLVVSREELVSKAQQLSQELQRTHADVQQIPALMSELECLRQEYQHCRATFEYEKKLYNDHLESLQGMEKNYISMSREVEKLRAELTNTANVDKKSSVPYGGTPGTNENEASGLPLGKNTYEDGYPVAQGRGFLSAASGGGAAGATTAAGAQPGAVSASTGYNAPRGPGYDASAGPAYDAQRAGTYDAQRLTGYDAVRGSAYDSQRGAVFDAQRTGYDPQRGTGYDLQRSQGYEMHRGPGYDASRASGYDAQSRGAVGPHGQAPPGNNMPYGSTTPPTRGGGGYEALPRGANPVRR
ncbi:protein FLX-like 2 [Gastrolobium bilobum]|uniref:protein FLX-like 2 n=1 Tax=Gastrolobium bilobum TaxID=150636 RepID=UPI002AAFEDF2|nr:protein FLX-like 2 [Gastrolobium bilobum]